MPGLSASRRDVRAFAAGAGARGRPALPGECRPLLGWKKDLRIDANEAWSQGEVADRIRSLEPFHLSAVEQPVPHADVAVLREVRQKVAVPIMLDESLCSQVDAERALEQGTCDLYN